jgi:hypothetical protein
MATFKYVLNFFQKTATYIVIIRKRRWADKDYGESKPQNEQGMKLLIKEGQ